MTSKRVSRAAKRAEPKRGPARLVSSTNATTFHREMATLMKPLAHAKRAGEMSAYMRGQFVYLGIPTPQRRKTAIVLIRALKPAATRELRAVAEALWQLSEREYQYIAVDLLMHHCALLTTKDLTWLLQLAQKRAWWDSVDSLVKVVSRIVRRDRVKGQHAMDRALGAKSFWVRRIAMLHQLGWREETDVERLFAYANRLACEGEFFIRKAVGWALRDYAWHDPIAVRRYLDRSREKLSALTLREAGKHC